MNMPFSDVTLNSFTTALASRAPVPGGGGAAAVTGSIAASLALMVINLTTGKKKYAEYEEELSALSESCEKARVSLLSLADEDAEAFLPLRDAYSIPKDEPGRGEIMEKALLGACEPPVKIMQECCKVIEVLERVAVIGSPAALSDAAAGAEAASAALRMASFNIFINAAGMKDAENRERLRRLTKEMLEAFVPRAAAAAALAEKGFA